MLDENRIGRQLALLREMADALAGSLAPAKGLTNALSSIIRLFGADAATIFVRHGDDLRLAAQIGLAEVEAKSVHRIPRGAGIVGRVMLTGEPRFIDDFPTDPEALYRYSDLRTGLCIPLETTAGIVGAMGVLRRTARPFNDGDLELLQLAGAYIATTVENTRQYQQMAERTSQLAALVDVAETVGRSLDPAEVFDALACQVKRLVEFDAVYVTVLKDEGTAMQLYSHEDVPHFPTNFTFPVAGSFLESAVAEPRTQVSDDLAGDRPYVTDQILFDFGYRSAIRVPLIAQGRAFGALTLASRQPRRYAEAPLELLSALAGQVAIALENARLYQAALRDKERWEATFNAIADPIAILSPEREIMRVNRTFVDLYGEPTADTCCFQASFGRQEPCQGCPLDRAVTLGVTSTGEVEGTTPDQRLRVLVYPMKNQEGQVYALVHVATDVTEQKRAQERLLLSEKLRALGQLASGVAHDINNVLALVLGRVDLLLLRANDPELELNLKTIRQAALDGAETARRLQTFAQTRQDENFSEVDLAELVRDVIRVTEPRWKDQAQQQGLRYELIAALPPVPPVTGNPAELRQALVNIVLNALDAMPAGGEIAFSVRQEGEQVLVTVRDTGIGLKDEVKARVFEPFFTTKGPAGSGLGLSITYGIVGRHGGTIDLDSQPGVGSTFAIRLPIATPRPAHPPPGPQASFAEGPRSILVVDDEPELGLLLRDMLELDGHRVSVCQDGREAIDLFERERHDLVLTDLGMPGLNGWEVARAIKDTSPGTPVVVVTGWGTEMSRIELEGKGIDEVVAKPYVLEDLRAALEKASLRAASAD